MAEFGGGGFLGAIGNILGGIAGFLRGFLAITTQQLLRLVQYLRDQLVALSKELLKGVWRAGRALARALLSLARLVRDALKPLLRWLDTKLRKLETWLKDLFGPLLRKLAQIKGWLQEFYKTFIRPIIDTIELIRHINSVLQVFHINLLGRLDRVLGQIEQKIEQPFLWANAQLTQIQNWIDRIITLDGLLQKVTLLRSLSKYAPEWMRIAVNGRMTPFADAKFTGQKGVLTRGQTKNIPAAIEASLLGRDGPYASFVAEFAAQWRIEIASA